VAAALLAAVALLLGPALAVAAEIPTLAGPVTDLTGVLEGQTDEVEAATDDLLADHDVQLFVLYVPTTDELNAPDFASQTAEANSLGADDALLLVAIDDRTDAIWVADGLDSITDDEIDAIISDALEPRLRDGDYAGAAVATAEALGTAAESPAPNPVGTPATGGGSSSAGGADDGGGGLIGIILLAAGVAVVGFIGYRALASRLSARREAEERDRRTGKLAREANALLVQTDERVRTALQEVDYVGAAYGSEETAPLQAAIAAAQQSLRKAFEIRQRLDDSEPEDPPTREAMLNEIVQLSRGAQAALDREAARIRELRDLERDAPTVLEELGPRIAAAEARLPDGEAAMAELSRTASASVEPVRGNLAEAQKGLAGARAAVQAGTAALTRNDRRTAARQARIAIVGVDGAAVLLDAIDKLLANVRDATVRIPQELEAALSGLEEARSARAASPAGGAGADGDALLDAAEQSIRDAQAAERRGDPLAALREATEAHREADTAVGAIRQASLERTRLLATADSSIAAARADIDRAASYVATRRTGVGRTARTRLAEARRNYEAAVAARDDPPQDAIEAARRAQRMAE
jgi:hypothetical protein